MLSLDDILGKLTTYELTLHDDGESVVTRRMTKDIEGIMRMRKDLKDIDYKTTTKVSPPLIPILNLTNLRLSEDRQNIL